MLCARHAQTERPEDTIRPLSVRVCLVQHNGP